MSTNISQSSENQNLTQQKIERLQLSVRKGWTPPPRISVPQWADDYRKLAKEAGSTSGNWETSTVEIARGPMLAATESGVHIITVMCCTQLMKTALLENLFGYFAHLDPCPILLLQPKEEAAEQFSKERISPLVRVTPVLRNIIGDSKQKSSKETILYKAFTGGFLALAGAGSPDNLARRPIRVLLADEVDKYPITREGDPIALAEERTATFGLNWLSVRACSPTVEDESRIADSYEDSDQRRASVVCPHCGHRQFLDFFKHVQWPKEGDKHLTKAAMIHCECCGAGWSEGERLRALQTIRWHQTKPFECCGSRPYSNFEVFESAVLRNFSSGTGLSPQQVTQDWSDVNYSSARSSLLEAWKTLTRRRDDFSMGTAQPLLTAFVEEVHDNEDLPLPNDAPDFVDARAAYSRARWMGPGRGWVDPVAEKKGAILGLDAGLSTLEIEVGENVGEDWEEILDQRQREIESCLKRGLPLPSWAQADQFASQTITDPEEK